MLESNHVVMQPTNVGHEFLSRLLRLEKVLRIYSTWNFSHILTRQKWLNRVNKSTRSWLKLLNVKQSIHKHNLVNSIHSYYDFETINHTKILWWSHYYRGVNPHKFRCFFLKFNVLTKGEIGHIPATYTPKYLKHHKCMYRSQYHHYVFPDKDLCICQRYQ